jgi:hypothetical protein
MLDNSTRSSGTVYRTDIDCRRIHASIRLPDSNLRNIIEVQQEIVPIIFIPGIMGSRLRDINGLKVWDPDSKIFMLAKFGAFWQSASERKDRLVGNAFQSEYLSVIEDDPSHNKKFADKTDRTRAERGWGGVGWSSYGDFLIALQNKQWEPLVHLNFRTPVHAFGYNWTACNGLAGKKLAAYIEKTIAFYNGKGRTCDGVILVTHSMGGLVARAACKLECAEKKVIGVIHGVQPAMGSAAAYWRMKGGFERPHTIPDLDGWQWLKNPSKMVHHKKETLLTKGYGFGMGTDLGLGNITTWVLGSDGEEVTSLLGNMPGGLELLPNQEYRDNDGNMQWLVLENPNGKKTRLPKSNPYQEIYSSQEEFYRLVTPSWLDPGGLMDTSLPGMDTPWETYLEHLRLAEKFHLDLLKKPMKIHHDTYQFYSTGIASADRVVFARTLDTWGAKGKRLLDIVKNEWFDQAKSTVADEAKGQMLNLIINPVKQTLLGGLSWRDVIFNPGKITDTVRSIPKVAGGAHGVLGTAIRGLPTTMHGVSSIAGAVGKGLIVTAAKTAVGLLVRDTEWYINRGGYQDKVDENLKPHREAIHKHDDLPPEAVYVITMKTPDGAGDGTVPESSARALKPFAAASVKYDKKGKKIRRTFAIGDASGVEAKFTKKKAPRTQPKHATDFDEGWFDRGHEPIYKTQSAQHITFTVIESICRRRIAGQKGRR